MQSIPAHCMLFARPLILLCLALVAFLGSTTPSRMGGFREPLARRLSVPPACGQQVAQEQDFGVLRWKGSRRKARC